VEYRTFKELDGLIAGDSVTPSMVEGSLGGGTTFALSGHDACGAAGRMPALLGFYGTRPSAIFAD
jgi:hypothetical protein